jgi:hypothetical protein
MARKLLVTLALLLLIDTAGAVRVLEQAERPVELTLSDLSLPAAGGSTISFSECATCGSSTHRLTDQTVYKANGRVVALADFLLVADEIRAIPNGAANAMAVVFLDIETGRITRIELRGYARVSQ